MPDAPAAHLFEELPEAAREGVRALGWTEPLPVQARVVPPMRAGGDLIVQARTGSGKTGAFGIPIVCATDPDRAETQTLILEPTRELANQVTAELTTLGRPRGIRVLPIYGGTSYQPQIDGLAEGAHVVVGTPGRILDHLGAGRLKLGAVRIFVLDEADELLSLGFWPDMREIKSYLPRERQTCLFSATIPEKVRALSRQFQGETEFISMLEGQSSPSEIEHFFYMTTAQEKEQTLRRVLEYEEPESAIVFCNTKSDVRFVTSFLQRQGFDADQISGDLPQSARERAMQRIKAGELKYLVATDVAARGIDISDLSHVISYSTPDSPEVYVHRTGRTGRAGKAGVAISLVSGLDVGNFRQVQSVNKIKITERKLPSEDDLLQRTRQRLAAKVEQEIREIPPSERAFKVDRFIPIVEELAATEDGKRDLAAICASYLREHRPDTAGPARTTAPPPPKPAEHRAAAPAEADASDAAHDAGRADRPPRPREGGERGGGRGRGGRRRGGRRKRSGGGGSS